MNVGVGLRKWKVHFRAGGKVFSFRACGRRGLFGRWSRKIGDILELRGTVHSISQGEDTYWSGDTYCRFWGMWGVYCSVGQCGGEYYWAGPRC